MSLELVYQELRLIRADIKELRQEVSRYKGFVHGVLWCLGGIAGVLGYLRVM